MIALGAITKTPLPSDNSIRREDGLPHEREIMSNINNNRFIIGAVIIFAMIGAYFFLAYVLVPEPSILPHFFDNQRAWDYIIHGVTNPVKV